MAGFASPYGFSLPAIDQAIQGREENALRQMLLKKQTGQIDRDISKQNALAQWLSPAMGGNKDALAQVMSVDPDTGMKVANYLKPAVGTKTNLEKLIEARDALPDGDKRIAHFEAAIAKETRAEADPLVEIYDPNSPTGTRMVPRSQGANQPGKPASGMKIESDGKGGFTLTQGRGAGGSGFSQPTVNKIEEQIVGNASRMARVADMVSAYRPEFLTFGNQVTNWAASQIEKLDPSMIGPETKANLAAFTDFKSKAFNDLNLTLKEMSGAAITPQEAERLLKVLGDPTNDSPTQFKAKLDGISREVRMSQARLLYLRQFGADGAKKMADINLSDMPRIIKNRESQLVSEIKASNPQISDDELKSGVRTALRKEFGL